MFKKTTAIITTAVLASGVSSAFAAETGSTGIDLSPLTNAIDFGSVVVAIMAVAVTICGLYAANVGIKWVLRAVRSA